MRKTQRPLSLLSPTKPIEINTILVDLSKEEDARSFFIPPDKNQQPIIDKIDKIINHHGAIAAQPISMIVGRDKETSLPQQRRQLLDLPLNSVNGHLVQKELFQSIIRYMKPNDKITQLTSTLLKSWLYYFYHRLYHYDYKDEENDHYDYESKISSHACNSSDHEYKKVFPITLLQRSKYGKPYIQLEFLKDIRDVNQQSSLPSATHEKVNNTTYKDKTKHPRSFFSWWAKNDTNITPHRNKINEKHHHDSCNSDAISSANKVLLSLPFSISHQYPITALSFITIAPNFLHSKYNKKCIERISEGNEVGLPLIGMDVVIFESTNGLPVKDTLNFYQKSFTEWEWKQINDDSFNEKEKLIEFYLRWSMKEAYTKALGVGLGKEFQSFEFRLAGFDSSDDGEHDDVNNDTDCSGSDNFSGRGRLWNCILHKCENNGNRIAYFPAYLYDFDSEQKIIRDDDWSFYFLPISSKSGDAAAMSTSSRTTFETDESFFGCSCICIKTSDEGNIMNDFHSPIQMKSCISRWNMSLKDLCDSHNIK